MGRRTIGEYTNELLKLPNGQIVYDYGMRLACEDGDYTKDNFLCQKIICKFICDRIECFSVPYPAFQAEMRQDILETSCLTYAQLHRYARVDALYAWHISDIKIYDKPKELSEFRKPIDCHRGNEKHQCIGCWDCEIKRPPQSWCYVERLDDEQ